VRPGVRVFVESKVVCYGSVGVEGGEKRNERAGVRVHSGEERKEDATSSVPRSPKTNALA